MILKKVIPLFVGVLICGAFQTSAVPIVETIPGIAVENGHPQSFSFAAEPDRDSTAVLTFKGAALLRAIPGTEDTQLARLAALPLVLPGLLSIKFDWAGPNGEEVFSPAFLIALRPNVLTDIDLAYRIPFCPKEVSIHFENGGELPIALKGLFTHDCIPRRVPDGGVGGFQGVLLALAGVHWAVRRKLRAA